MHNFKKIGNDVKIWDLAKIIFSENIVIGDSVIIDDFTFIMSGPNTIIGSFVHISSGVIIVGRGDLNIGDFVNISPGCRLLTGSDDFGGGALLGPVVPQEFRKTTRSFIDISKHVVIGANTVVLPGLTIGEGVAVGANSLVNRDLDPWKIYAGSPVKCIKDRPKDKILDLEKKLRGQLYDENGQYKPWMNL